MHIVVHIRHSCLLGVKLHSQAVQSAPAHEAFLHSQLQLRKFLLIFLQFIISLCIVHLLFLQHLVILADVLSQAADLVAALRHDEHLLDLILTKLQLLLHDALFGIDDITSELLRRL